MSTNGNWKLGITLSLITAIMWGLLPYSVTPLLNVLDPYTITFFRMFGGALLLLIWLSFRKRNPFKFVLTPTILTLLAVAVIALCSNYFYWLKGLDLTNPSTAQVVIQIAPMLLLLGSVVIYKESFSKMQLVGVIVFVGGLLLFFNQRLGNLLNEFSGYNLGVFYILFSAVVWSIYALIQKKLLDDFKALNLIFIITGMGSLVFLPFASPSKVLELNNFQLSMLAFGAANTAIAYGCFTEAMRFWNASRVSAVISIVPVLTLASGYILHQLFPEYIPQESINLLSIVGAFVVVIGSSITALSKSTKAH